MVFRDRFTPRVDVAFRLTLPVSRYTGVIELVEVEGAKRAILGQRLRVPATIRIPMVRISKALRVSLTSRRSQPVRVQSNCIGHLCLARRPVGVDSKNGRATHGG